MRRAIQARAEAIGIGIRGQRWVAFILAGAGAGVAGSLYAFSRGSVDPSLLGIPTSVDALTMLLLGGIQTIAGPIVGSAVLHILKDQLMPLTSLWRLVLGLSIIGMVLIFPRGLVGQRANGARSAHEPPDRRASGKVLCAVVAARDVSFSLERGEMLALIGPNGAGKSTVFNMIGGQLRPDRGAVLLDGQTITLASPQDRFRRGIGRTFQVAQAFQSMTVCENVQMTLMSLQGETYALLGQARQRHRHAALGLLDRVGMEEGPTDPARNSPTVMSNGSSLPSRSRASLDCS